MAASASRSVGARKNSRRMSSDSATTQTTRTIVAMTPRRLMRSARHGPVANRETSAPLDLARALVRQRRFGGTSHAIEHHADALERAPVRRLKRRRGFVRCQCGRKLIDVVVRFAE